MDVWRCYLKDTPRFMFVNFLAVLSELQAGVPMRLVGCCWVMIAWAANNYELNTGRTDLKIIKNTADYIEDHGFIEERETPMYKIDDDKVFDEDHQIYKWMNTSPDRISFESMIVDRFPRYGAHEKAISKMAFEAANVHSGRTPLTPSAGPRSPIFNTGGSSPPTTFKTLERKFSIKKKI